MSNLRQVSVYEGRELIGMVAGIDRLWRAFDARGNALPGGPYKSERLAVAAVQHCARPCPCVVWQATST